MAKRTSWGLTPQQEAFQKAQEKARRARDRFGVFLHSSGAGGYVVRTGEEMDGGRVWFPAPYSDLTPEAVYKRRSAAERKAEEMNA